MIVKTVLRHWYMSSREQLSTYESHWVDGGWCKVASLDDCGELSWSCTQFSLLSLSVTSADPTSTLHHPSYSCALAESLAGFSQLPPNPCNRYTLCALSGLITFICRQIGALSSYPCSYMVHQRLQSFHCLCEKEQLLSPL